MGGEGTNGCCGSQQSVQQRQTGVRMQIMMDTGKREGHQSARAAERVRPWSRGVIGRGGRCEIVPGLASR